MSIREQLRLALFGSSSGGDGDGIIWDPRKPMGGASEVACEEMLAAVTYTLVHGPVTAAVAADIADGEHGQKVIRVSVKCFSPIPSSADEPKRSHVHELHRSRSTHT